MTSVVIFHYHLVSCCKLQFHAIGRPSDLSMGVYTGYQARRSTQGQLKITHINFAILNSHVTVVHLRFNQSAYIKVRNFHQANFASWKNCVIQGINFCEWSLYCFLARINFREWVNLSNLKECLGNCPTLQIKRLSNVWWFIFYKYYSFRLQFRD